MTIAVIGIFLVMIWGRAFYGSMKSFEEGKAFLEKNQIKKAVNSFDRSLHWYTPLNPYIEKSAAELWQISKQAETDGDIRLAMIAAETLRRGFVAARSFYVPGKDWIERCDARLRGLLMLQQSRGELPRGTVIPDNSILNSPQVAGPDVLWSIVALGGFLGWVGSVMAVIVDRKKRRGTSKSVLRLRMKWIMLCIFFWVAWVVGMMRA